MTWFTAIPVASIAIALVEALRRRMRRERLEQIRLSLAQFSTEYARANTGYLVASGGYERSRVHKDLNVWVVRNCTHLRSHLTMLRRAFKVYHKSSARADPAWDSPRVLQQSLSGMLSTAPIIRAAFRKLLDEEQALKTPFPPEFVRFVRYRCEQGTLFPEISIEQETLQKLLDEFEADLKARLERASSGLVVTY